MSVIYGPYRATIADVHDGDTANVDIDLGFGITVHAACRVYGINAPELATAAGKVARDFAHTLLHPGDRVTVLSHGWDKYGGRFDGEILLADGRSFSELMLAAGQAVPFMV